MDRKLNGIKYGLVQHIFLPAPCKKSVGGGEMGGGGGLIMVLISGKLYFHLEKLLEWGRKDNNTTV